MMVGAKLPEMHVDPPAPSAKPMLEVRALSAPAADTFGVDLADISFDVFGGEIVGIAGVSGNGQAELVALLSGERCTTTPMRSASAASRPARSMPIAAAALGLAFVPEERLGRGAVPVIRSPRTAC